MVQFAEDHRGRTIVQAPAFGQNLYKTSAFSAWGGIVAISVSILLVLTSILTAIVWIPMWLFGRKGIRFKRARAFPLLWAVSFLGLLFIFIASQEVGDALANLGNPTAWSMGIFIGGILLVVFAIASAITAFQSFGRDMNRVARIHSLLTTIGILFITGYLGYWGMLGLRTWAF